MSNQGKVELKDICIDSEMMSLIIDRITEAQTRGFGDITVYIRNGHIYRVRTSLEDYMSEDFTPEEAPT